MMFEVSTKEAHRNFIKSVFALLDAQGMIMRPSQGLHPHGDRHYFGMTACALSSHGLSARVWRRHLSFRRNGQGFSYPLRLLEVEGIFYSEDGPCSWDTLAPKVFNQISIHRDGKTWTLGADIQEEPPTQAFIDSLAVLKESFGDQVRGLLAQLRAATLEDTTLACSHLSSRPRL